LDDLINCCFGYCHGWRRAGYVGCSVRCGPDGLGQVSGYRNGYRRSEGSGSRWMDLRYAGTCKVCGARIGTGERGYWDTGARTVTCSALACCEADGLTTQEWSGSPVSGQFVVVRSEHRVGSAAPAGSLPGSIRGRRCPAMRVGAARNRAADAATTEQEYQPMKTTTTPSIGARR
jgi:hypothetical protein